MSRNIPVLSDPHALARPDAPAVAALIRRAFARLPEPVDPPPSALRETAESVAAMLAEGGGAGIALRGDLVGAVLWAPRDGALYVARLSVDPDWRGRGIARLLLGTAEQAARMARLPAIALSTRLAMAGNRRLFASMGFVERSRHTHPGYAEPTYVSLEKRLS